MENETITVGDVPNVAEKTTIVEKVCKRLELLYEQFAYFLMVYFFITIVLAWGDLATQFEILAIHIYAQISLLILGLLARAIREEVEHERWIYENRHQWWITAYTN